MWEPHLASKVIISMNTSGLGNRLKSLASAMRLNSNCRVLWPLDRRCNCPFSELFENDIEISSKQFDRKELVLHENGMKIEGACRYEAWRIATIEKDNLPENFNTMGKGFNNWRYSGKLVDMEYNRTPKHVIQDVSECFARLKPKRELLAKINRFSQDRFDQNTVSVQIRSCERDALGDSWSVDRYNSFSLEPYISLIKDYISLGRDSFFVSTDREFIVDELKNIFGEKIISYPRNTTLKGSRQNIEGMQEDEKRFSAQRKCSGI